MRKRTATVGITCLYIGIVLLAIINEKFRDMNLAFIILVLIIGWLMAARGSKRRKREGGK